MTKEPSLAEIDDRLVDLIREWWKDHKKPLLLSQLGARDDGNLAAQAKQEAGGLAAYIRSRLAERVRVIQHDEMPALVGAVPADAGIEEYGGANVLLERTRSQLSGTTRFHPALWAAFRKPLDESRTRYVSHTVPVHFEDVPPSEQPLGEFTEVERSYILDTAEASQVQRKIEDWLAANNLDSGAFHVAKGHEKKSLPANDLLGRMLVALDPDQLRRTTMPLDVVDRLRRQPL